MTWASLGHDSARELVDLKHARADSQLSGAVAVHNILQRERVAYLADEVGLGKTYVALATAALMRHFDPGFRVLIIAPRSNIQRKWTNDWRSFVSRNWVPTDLRVKAVSGAPARPMLASERLVDLVHDVAIEPDTDAFARLTSFSFAAVGDRHVVQERVRRVLPWLKPSDFPRDERKLRDFVAQAYNAAMPTYDLVIIDEAHNLKGGVQIRDGVVGGGALRNAVLAQVLGHPEVTPHPLFAETYRPLADRVLLLSATPVEESFRNLWNQLHLVGKHAPEGRADFAALKDNDEHAREAAARVLVRRINTVEIGGVRHTKSQYRRTWHQGGIGTHDEALSAGTIRQRLSVALVQKKVSDLIGTKFNNQFQMGMLASFESFAETALKQPKASEGVAGATDDEGPAESNFDGDQTTDPAERLGIDTSAVNQLARHHFDTFGVELAHPKMDALVTDLARSWRTGEKALVFVRRVASVTEIKRKLDESYDEWLLERLEVELPAHVWTQVTAAHATYPERRAAEGRHLVGPGDGDRDAGGADTFFAWFFRGEGPDLKQPTAAGSDPIESGASLARRLGMASGAASTFLAEHYLADLLSCRPDEVLDQLAEALGESPETVAVELEERARHYLPVSAGRRHTFDAVQAAGLELLRDSAAPHQPLQEAATVLTGELQLAPGDRRTLAFDVRRQLMTPTFFTRLLDHRELAEALLPTAVKPGRDKSWVREHYVRTALLAAALRLGQPLIDLYGAFMQVSTRASVTDNNEVDAAIDKFLELLERQRNESAPVGALVELASISRDFDLVRHQNLPSTTREEFLLAAAGTECGTLMGKQQPTVGMAGRVNQTAVRQFRMPGYPYALICTDVLQEGEDLHTYCDRVIHYGVAWTASAMEQRTGRVDRINSLAERRFVDLQNAGAALEGHDKIQVQLPYLTETVERVQARTVLRRMHTFVSLMHHGLDADERRLDLAAEILNDDWLPPQGEQPLESAFDVKPADLKGRSRGRLTSDNLVEEWWTRLARIAQADDLNGYFAKGSQDRDRLAMYGSRSIGDRVQPFSLQLLSRDSMPVVSVRTPIGRHPDVEGGDEALVDELTGVLDRVIVLEHAATREYDVAIAGDVILGDPEHDTARVLGLIRRITDRADEIESELTRGDLKLADVQTTLQKDIGS